MERVVKGACINGSVQKVELAAKGMDNKWSGI
jgi:hypothetical protein